MSSYWQFARKSLCSGSHQILPAGYCSMLCDHYEKSLRWLFCDIACCVGVEIDILDELQMSNAELIFS